MYNGKVQNYLSALGLQRTEIKKKKKLQQTDTREIARGGKFRTGF